MKPLLYIFGAGGHAKEVIECAIATGTRPDLILDDNPHVSELFGIPIVPTWDADMAANFNFVVAIGNCQVRHEKFERLLNFGHPLTLIHPRAYVSPSAAIGKGTVVLPFASVEACAVVGQNVILNVHSLVGHDCEIGDHAHISGNAALGGACKIGARSWISLGASVKEGVTIGDDAFIGIGAMISKDVDAHKKAISPNRREFVVMDH